MKKIFLYCISLALSFGSFAQGNPAIPVKKIVLDNGLTVLLSEDHSEPKVFGAVVVKAGSKNDPQGATGTAHYFEHIMFKGTDSIGTLDYASEKVYLDSIAMLYDILNATTDKEQRKSIGMHINNLSIKASEYAIPNEVDILIKKYGGTQLNAYTSFDQTVYHNVFPPNQIERWLKIYAERFRNPVFRLFQSELETVYEERNMYADQMGSKMMEDMMKVVFKKHPYRNPLIGTVEDLKNPSLTKMRQFYLKYYVPGNMALVISGDFDAEKIEPLIKQYFGEWEKGETPVFHSENFKEAPFEVGENFSGRYVPMNMGMLCFRGVPAKHKDEVALDVCCDILSNGAATGLLDSLRVANKVMGAYASNMQLNDEGLLMVTYMPKMVGGSLSKTKEEMLQMLARLKAGDFSEELLNSVKLNYRKNEAQMLENFMRRGNLLVDAFASNYSWEEYQEKAGNYQKITKEDIVNIAKLYFTENYLTFTNKRGLSSKAEKIEKPGYAPVIPENAEKESVFVLHLDSLKAIESEPVFVDFAKDFKKEELQKNLQLITSKNPVNDIFSLGITFGSGTKRDSVLDLLREHLDDLGTQAKTITEFRKAMQKIGSSYSVYASSNSVSISVSGFDEYLLQTLSLLNELLTQLKPDDSQMAKLVESIKLRDKMELKDQNSISDALYYYAVYGKESPYIKRFTAAEVEKMKSETIVNSFKKVLNYETLISYVGTLSHEEVKNQLLKAISFPKDLRTKDTLYEKPLQYNNPTVFICNNKRANQSNLCFYWAEYGQVSENERLQSGLFNQYFGSGMSSLLFQEIREFRSLAYRVYGGYSFPSRQFPSRASSFYGDLSTQSDKTNEAIGIYMDLLKKMPQKPEKLEVIKESVKESINSSRPNFRSVPGYVYSLMEEGFTEDYRKIRYEYTQIANFGDIVSFYEKFIQSKPTVITITGNEKKFDLKDLEKHGKVVEVKTKEIFR